jgi:growth factor-regulated tyrosine kinase substrate
MVMETPRTEYSYAPYGEQQHQYAQSYPPSTLPAAPAAPALPNYDLEPLESDAILTFNQMVEQVHAQNRPDVARYPAVNELYQKAANLNPKLAMSVDDTDRKQRESVCSDLCSTTDGNL